MGYSVKFVDGPAKGRTEWLPDESVNGTAAGDTMVMLGGEYVLLGKERGVWLARLVTAERK